MADYRRVVDRIQRVLRSGDQRMPPDLEDLARQYSDALTAVNDRLQRCCDFLRRGLRTEAIQLATAAPDVFECVETLDFDELDRWKSLLETYGLPAPPDLFIAETEALQDAYALERPIEELLYRHRLLALERRPLSERLSVMRQLAARDAQNVFWRDDIEAFERARHDQILVEAKEAQKAANLEVLRALVTEVDASHWSVPVPASTAERVRNAFDAVKSADIHKQLTKIGDDLADAVAACDFSRGSELALRWRQLAAELGAKLDPELHGRCEPSLEWVDEQAKAAERQQAYQLAIAELESALDTPRGLADLERLYHAILRFEEGVPPILEKRYQTRIVVLQRQATRQRWTIGTAIAAAVVLIAVLIGWVIDQQIRTGKIAESVAAVEAALNEHRLAEARKLAEQCQLRDAGVYASQPFQAVLAKLHAAEEQEQKRLSAFQSLLTDLQNAPLEQTKPEPHDRLQSLAHNDEEKAEIARVMNARERERAKSEQQKDEEFLAKVADLAGELEALEKDVEGEKQAMGSLAPKIDRFEAKIAAVEAGAKRRSEEAQTQLLALRGRLVALRDFVKARVQESEGLAKLSEAASRSLDDYLTAMQEYVTRLPSDRRSRSFQQVIEEEAAVWKGEFAWSGIRDRWKPQSLSEVNPESADVYRSSLAQFAKNHKDHPAVPTTVRVCDHLARVKSRIEGGPSLKDSLLTILNANDVKSLWLIRYKEVNTPEMSYYLPTEFGPPEWKKDGDTMVLDGKFITSSQRDIRPKRFSKRYTLADTSAPQTQIADRVRRPAVELSSKNATEAAWTGLATEIVDAALTTPNLDPVKACQFLVNACYLAKSGSVFLESGFEEAARQLEQAQVNTKVNWISPEDRDAAAERAKARQFLEEARTRTAFEVPGIRQASARALNECQAQLNLSHQPIGWLDESSDRSWDCLAMPKALEAHKGPPRELWVVVRDGDGKFHWKAVGRLAEGKITLTEGLSRDAARTGRLVWVEKVSGP